MNTWIYVRTSDDQYVPLIKPNSNNSKKNNPSLANDAEDLKHQDKSNIERSK